MSPANVHALRVETRRLLALLDLFDPLLPKSPAKKISRCLKKPFKAGGRLRDMHVMLQTVRQRLGRFPEAKCFKKELQRLEKRLLKKLEQATEQTRVKRMKRRMDAFREQLHAAASTLDWRHSALVGLRKRVDKAFADVVAQRRKILPADPLTIHRTRVAFKKFRYMVEQLQPLLPELPANRLNRLREYQKLMGDIQDSETLLTTLDHFLSEEESAGRSLKQFRLAMQHKYAGLIANYLGRADELFTFWRPAVAPGRAKS